MKLVYVFDSHLKGLHFAHSFAPVTRHRRTRALVFNSTLFSITRIDRATGERKKTTISVPRGFQKKLRGTGLVVKILFSVTESTRVRHVFVTISVADNAFVINIRNNINRRVSETSRRPRNVFERPLPPLAHGGIITFPKNSTRIL